MLLYSQKDPAYDRLKLGASKLTIHGYGCFVCSLATLYQKTPQELLKIPNAISDQGYLRSALIARECGGAALPATATAPDGWCVAMTTKFKDIGYPTHFFLFNSKTKQQLDPLDFPMLPEPLSYYISEYRPFTNTKLDLTIVPKAGPFPDVPADAWSAESVRRCKELGIMKGYPDGLFKPNQGVTREELAAVVTRLYDCPR